MNDTFIDDDGLPTERATPTQMLITWLGVLLFSALFLAVIFYVAYRLFVEW